MTFPKIRMDGELMMLAVICAANFTADSQILGEVLKPEEQYDG